MVDPIPSDATDGSTTTAYIKEYNTRTQKGPSKRKVQVSHDNAPFSDQSTLLPSSESDPITKPARASALRATLDAEQTERRHLLRQIHAHMNSKGSQPTESHPPAPPTLSAMLPSMAAHWQPAPPLTPGQEAEAAECARAVIKEHIRLLHEYNQIRDVGQALIGIVAESRRLRVRDCHEEFGIMDGD